MQILFACRKPRHTTLSEKHTDAKAWMGAFFKKIGDQMPHKAQVHLPHFLTKKNVYIMMKREMQERGQHDTISLSHFYAIWNDAFHDVVIPKVKYMTSF